MSGMNDLISNERYVSTHFSPAKMNAGVDIVLLHGWGGNARAWQPLLPELTAFASVTVLEYAGNAAATGLASTADIDSLCDALVASTPRGAFWMGWSLGGLLAVRAARRHPSHFGGVVTLGSNPCFIANASWPGMPAEVFAGFQRGLEQHPEKTLERFTALQFHGGSKTILKQWREHVGQQACAASLAQGLQYLAELDLRDDFAALNVPALALFAEQDALVPTLAGHSLGELWASKSDGRVLFYTGSHGFGVEQPALVARELKKFVGHLQQSSSINKRDVARSFSQAAATYDAVATLQRQVGQTLLQQCPERAHRILDLGCGTGYFSARLQKRYPKAQVVGLDLAEGMVRYAKAHHEAQLRDWLVGDAEQLPLANNSVDLIYSSLVVQWCQRPEKLWSELARVLKPGGLVLCATLGPDTLKELRCAWADVDKAVHVNDFADIDVLKPAIPRTLTLTCERESIVLRYGFLMSLLKELKSLGAHNINQGRKRGMTGKRQFQALINAYERFRENGELPATYDVMYLRLQKNANESTP